MFMMLCSSFSDSNTRGVTFWGPERAHTHASVEPNHDFQESWVVGRSFVEEGTRIVGSYLHLVLCTLRRTVRCDTRTVQRYTRIVRTYSWTVQVCQLALVQSTTTLMWITVACHEVRGQPPTGPDCLSLGPDGPAICRFTGFIPNWLVELWLCRECIYIPCDWMPGRA
jgi:hypothetical protein